MVTLNEFYDLTKGMNGEAELTIVTETAIFDIASIAQEDFVTEKCLQPDSAMCELWCRCENPYKFVSGNWIHVKLIDIGAEAMKDLHDDNKDGEEEL